MKKKVLIGIVIVSVVLAFTAVFSISFRQDQSLHSLENEVRTFSLPPNIERVAIKSSIGDSGGNGDYSTLRVVLVVKTELNIIELGETIENMNLRFQRHYEGSGNIPIYYISKCNNSTFQSSRHFTMDFEELEVVENYSNYYFIEFVE